MRLQLARILGIIVAALAAVGLFTSGHFIDLINVDPLLDVVRIILAAYLLYAGFAVRTASAVNSALLVTGVVYLGLGVAGLVSSTIGGLLPSGLTEFDILSHLAIGGLATLAAVRGGQHMALHSR